MFEIEFTIDAVEDFRLFRKIDRKLIVEAITEQLSLQPDQETRDRKKLRPNSITEWELRVDRFRVFYDVDTGRPRVKVEAIGH